MFSVSLYKTTYIDVEEMKNMLGENGKIIITYGNNQVVNVTSETQKGEGDFSSYYKVTYTGDVNEITIQTTKP